MHVFYSVRHDYVVWVIVAVCSSVEWNGLYAFDERARVAANGRYSAIVFQCDASMFLPWNSETAL